MAETHDPKIRRLLAPNPSPMTHTGTNTYLLGRRDIAVIDPGPDNDAHFAAILSSIAPYQKITKILVTHAHLDHAPLARRLSIHCGAPVFAYGDSAAGRSPQMIALCEAGTIGGGEGVDDAFQPDVILKDQVALDHEGQELTAIWTPGHFGNHMAFAWNGAMFSGDHVMGWASTMISPPDGDLGAFRRSCTALQQRPEKLYLPGHGDAIEDGPARLDWLLAHRQQRESQIISHLKGRPNTAQSLAKAIYSGINPQLIPAATRNVLAHLIDLCERDLATCHGPIDLQAKYSVI
ncbi:MAG: MBL fold metallo-hydrolase [Planktomarina sp.]|uniref:MBL fold metallo-hydrolase n=2 Tax=Planktomarina sp. TaxID=2024851 RepID=UPI003C42DB67